jgi:hypothetical protein
VGNAGDAVIIQKERDPEGKLSMLAAYDIKLVD